MKEATTSTKELVTAVSRSFALSLNALPGSLRLPISTTYLLARLTDTLADAPQVPVGQRLDALGRFDELVQRQVLDAERELKGLARSLKQTFLPDHAHAGEQALLARTEEVFSAYLALPYGERDLVRKALVDIVKGQQLDLIRFGDTNQRRTLTTEDELDEYTYLVAGSVGNFWTRMGAEVDRHFLQPETALDEVCALGVSYGHGLQLLNIYRDAGSDLGEGRCYFPRETMDRKGLKLTTIETNPTRWREAWLPWRDRCETHLRDGLTYTTRLRSARCRLASGLPAVLGLATLQALDEADDDEWLAGVKIGRSKVKRLLAQASFACLTRNGLRRLGS